MNKVSVSFVVVLLLAASGAFAGQLIDDVPYGIPGEYVVTFSPGTPSGVAAGLAAQHGAGVARSYHYALNGAHFTNLSRQAASALARNPNVLRVEQNGRCWAEAVQENPPSWGLDRIDQRELPLDNSYTYDFTGAGIDAYILDTGIRPTHVDFGGRASADYDTVGDGQNGIDCHGHGTHVAGTVGGTSYGVAKEVMLHAVRVLNCGGFGTWAGVIAGIDWVTQQKVDNPSALMVANMSLGGGYNQSVNDAVTASVNAGVFYAIAAGNSNANACNYSPAATPEACTVGSTTVTDTRSSFSNYGPCLDLFAPGSAITSAWHTSDTASNTISGTSMASPHVCGAGALVLEEFPALAGVEVCQEIVNRATPDVVINPGAGSPNLLLYTLSECIPVPEICYNGIDDDCDGLIDKEDPDCKECSTYKEKCETNADCCKGLYCNLKLNACLYSLTPSPIDHL